MLEKVIDYRTIGNYPFTMILSKTSKPIHKSQYVALFMLLSFF